MAGYNNGHNEGDVRTTAQGWQEFNYLEETASGISSSFISGTFTLSIPGLNSFPRLDFRSPILHFWFWQIFQIYDSYCHCLKAQSVPLEASYPF